MHLGIVGSRNYVDYEAFKTHIEETLKKWNVNVTNISSVVSGGAKGADSLAERWAKDNAIPTTVFKPDWNKLGKKAGILRNTDIVNESTHLVAFPTKDSIGTWDSIRKSTKKGIPTEVIKV
jgi:hypothetical protein